MNWQFSLIDYTTNPSGDTTIIPEPSGWDSITLSIKRDMEMHGIFFEFSETSLTFYKEAFAIIRDAYESDNVEARVELKVEYMCADCDSFKQYYYGRCLFVKYQQECSDICSVTIPVEQSGSIMTFRNRLDQPVDLATAAAFDGTALSAYTFLPFTTSLPSKGIYKNTDRYLCADETITSCRFYNKAIPIGLAINLTTRDHTKYYTLAYDCINKDEVGTYAAIDIEYDSLADTPATIIIEEDGVYNLEALVKGKINAWAYANAAVLGGGGSNGGFNTLNIDIWVVINETVVDTLYTLTDANGYNTDQVAASCYGYIGAPSPPIGSGVDHDWNFNTGTFTNTYNLVAGDRVAIVVSIHQQGQYHQQLLSHGHVAFEQWLQVDGGSSPCVFKLNLISYAPATDVKIFAINESFARITEAISDNKMSMYSDYFGRTDAQPYTSARDGCGALEAITKGLLIRQQTVQGNNPVMAVSFAELFAAFNCIHNIGIGLEDDTQGSFTKLIRIEPVDYFYDASTIILTCDNVANVTREPLDSKYFSVVKFGYEKYEAEDYTGIDEYFSQRQYRSTLTQIKQTDDRLCKFIASGYSIEVTRRKFNLDTKDWRLDNDKFILCLKRDGGDLVIEQGNIDATANIVDPATTFNNPISPIRNAMRWLKTWIAGFKNYTTGKFAFTAGTGNYFASGHQTSGCIQEAAAVAENADLTASMFADANDAAPLWKPEIARFDYPLSAATPALIAANPYGVVQFNCADGVQQYGFILDIENKPNDGMATFTLLIANR